MDIMVDIMVDTVVHFLTFWLSLSTLNCLTFFSSFSRSPLHLHNSSLCLASCLVSMESSTALVEFLSLFSSDMKFLWSFWISFCSSATADVSAKHLQRQKNSGETVALWATDRSSEGSDPRFVPSTGSFSIMFGSLMLFSFRIFRTFWNSR